MLRKVAAFSHQIGTKIANQPILGMTADNGYEPAQSRMRVLCRTDDQTVAVNSNFNSQLNDNLIINAGVSLILNRTIIKSSTWWCAYWKTLMVFAGKPVTGFK
jgi:hypothetical protein